MVRPNTLESWTAESLSHDARLRRALGRSSCVSVRARRSMPTTFHATGAIWRDDERAFGKRFDTVLGADRDAVWPWDRTSRSSRDDDERFFEDRQHFSYRIDCRKLLGHARAVPPT